MFHRSANLLLPVLMLLAVPSVGAAQQSATPQITRSYGYPDIADLALASSIVAHVKVRKAERLKGKFATGVAAGRIRYLITADVIALIRAPSALAKRLTYLIDIAVDSAGRPTSSLKGELVVFAQPGRPGELRLVTPDAHITYSPELAQMARAILTEAIRPDASPKVTGIDTAFYAPGNLTGDGESQVFLEAEGDRPVSLNIRRLAGEPPRWFASTSDTVDENAVPPRRNTLSWYRLACALPPVLPTRVTADMDGTSAAAVATDYAFVMQDLGRCVRLRTR
jgi:hypothetical protein